MNIHVVPAMLILAREAQGWTQSDLAQKTGISQGNISKYESGLLHADEDQLQKIADVLAYPSAFFYLDESKYNFGSSCTYHRKRQTMPVSELRQLLAQINILRIRIARLLNNIDLESENEFPRLDIQDYESPMEIARMVRRQWRLAEGPIPHLALAFEDAGGILFQCSFGTRKLDAISQWVLRCPPFFFANTDMPGERVRFSLAHELGHIVMHQNATDTREDEADAFASEFLMPADSIMSSLHHLTLEKAAALKPYWGVSMAALIYRASKLEVISPRHYRSLFEEMSKLGWRIAEPNPIALEEPTLIRAMIEAHLSDFGYTYEELGKLLVIDPWNIDQLFSSTRTRLHIVRPA